MENITDAVRSSKIKTLTENVLITINKYLVVVWGIVFAAGNAFAVKEVIIAFGGFGDYHTWISIAGVLSLLAFSCFMVALLRKYFCSDIYSILLFGIAVIFMFRLDKTNDWRNLISSGLLPLIFYIILAGKKYVLYVPLICLLANLLIPNYITSFLPYYTVVYYFKREDVPVKRLQAKVFPFFAALILIIGILINYLYAESYLSDPMIFQFFNDYYHFGFTSRGFFSTFIYLFFGNNRPWSVIKWALFGIHTASVIGIIGFIYLIYKNISDKYSKDCKILALSVLSCGAVRFMCYSDRNMLFIDGVFICLAVICFYLVIKSRMLYMIPLLCALSMCIHHVFGILVFPYLFICMAYKCICSKKKNDFIVLIMSTFVTVALFIYFQFFAYRFSPLNFEDGIMYFERAIDIGKLPNLLYQNIRYVVFNGKVDSYGIQYDVMLSESKLIFVRTIIYHLLFLLPEIVIVKNFFSVSDKKIFAFMGLAQFVSLVSYMEIDYYRWNITIALFLPVTLLSMVAINPTGNWLCRFKNESRKDVFIFYMFVITQFVVAYFDK